jgi:hypothetical protein
VACEAYMHNVQVVTLSDVFAINFGVPAVPYFRLAGGVFPAPFFFFAWWPLLLFIVRKF